jgi:hypothetical protein
VWNGRPAWKHEADKQSQPKRKWGMWSHRVVMKNKIILILGIDIYISIDCALDRINKTMMTVTTTMRMRMKMKNAPQLRPRHKARSKRSNETASIHQSITRSTVWSHPIRFVMNKSRAAAKAIILDVISLCSFNEAFLSPHSRTSSRRDRLSYEKTSHSSIYQCIPQCERVKEACRKCGW